jgi:hypothetical protein
VGKCTQNRKHKTKKPIGTQKREINKKNNWKGGSQQHADTRGTERKPTGRGNIRRNKRKKNEMGKKGKNTRKEKKGKMKKRTKSGRSSWFNFEVGKIRLE